MPGGTLGRTRWAPASSLVVCGLLGLAQPRAKGESPGEMIQRASVALDQARSAMQKAAMFDKTAYGDPARNLSLMGEMRRALEQVITSNRLAEFTYRNEDGGTETHFVKTFSPVSSERTGHMEHTQYELVLVEPAPRVED